MAGADGIAVALGVVNEMPTIKMEKWELEDFIERLQSVPVDRVAFEDRAGSYETRQVSVWKLENGQYAVITESGCSCYDRSSADIEHFPSKKSAMASFEKWKKKNPIDCL